MFRDIDTYSPPLTSVKKYLGEKNSKMFLHGNFYVVFFTNCLLKCHSSMNTDPPLPPTPPSPSSTLKMSDFATALRNDSFCTMLHLKCLTVF